MQFSLALPCFGYPKRGRVGLVVSFFFEDFDLVGLAVVGLAALGLAVLLFFEDFDNLVGLTVGFEVCS